MITYRVKSLAELAAYFEIRAVQERAKSNAGKATTREEHFAHGQATAFESVAHMLRNAIIE